MLSMMIRLSPPRAVSRIGSMALTIGLLAAMATPAKAAYIEVAFERITGDSPYDVANQLVLRVYDRNLAVAKFSGFGLEAMAPDDVFFVFSNEGPVQSVIRGIYLADGAIMGISEVINSLEGTTNFEGKLAPGNLPGWGNDIQATEEFSIRADDPTPQFGVGPGEAVGVWYTTQEYPKTSGQFGLNAIAAALGNGDLLIGLHVIDLPDGESNSAHSTSFTVTAVPEPSSILLWGIGAIGLAGWSLRRRTVASGKEGRDRHTKP
jgi:hypothetical protein